MIRESGSPLPLPAAIRQALDHTRSGTRHAAEEAGRQLLAIPAYTSESVMREVEEVLASADPRSWIALEGVRDALQWDEPGSSMQRPPTDSDTVPTLCVKALLADGRVRERAVRQLAGTKSLAALPILALRAADWVTQVRVVARAAIVRRLDGGEGAAGVDGAALAAVAPMALHLARRQHGHWLAEQVTARLADPSAQSIVIRLLRSPTLPVRRAAYQSLAETNSVGLEDALHGALHDHDVVIRARCAALVARLAADSSSMPHLHLLLTSTTPIVRIEALSALNRLGRFELIRAALPDRSPLVRATARFYLRPRGVDFVGIYRELVVAGARDVATPQTSAALAGAIAGLGEVGGNDDADVVLPLLAYPRVRVQVEAIRALQALAPSVDAALLLAMIERTPSAAVTRQAVATFLARGTSIGADRLLALLAPDQPTRVRLAARQLLAERDSAWRLAVNVMLLGDPHEVVAARAMIDLEGALSQQLYTMPRGQTAELLAAHLPTADRILPAHASERLRLILRMPR